MKKVNKIIIGVIILLVVAGIGVGICYFVKGDGSFDILNIFSSDKTEITEFKYDMQSSEEKNLTVNNQEVKVVPFDSVYVNGKAIADINWNPTIYTIDDLFIFVSTGTDIRSTRVIITDKDGNVLKNIYSLDQKYNDMVIGNDANSVTFDGRNIILKGTRLTHGPAIYSVWEKYGTQSESDLYDCNVYKKYANEPVYGTYEIKYLGNNKFGDVTNTSYTKLKDSQINCINKEYEVEEITYNKESSEEQNLTINGLSVKFNSFGDLYVNNNKISSIIYITNIYTLDNNIIFVTGGTDIRSTSVLIVNKKGNLVKEIYNLDSKYSDMVIGGYENPIVITKEGITLHGTRITHGPAIVSTLTDVRDASGKVLTDCDEFNRYASEDVYGMYEINYLGNGSWSEIKNVTYTKLRDSGISCNNTSSITVTKGKDLYNLAIPNSTFLNMLTSMVNKENYEFSDKEIVTLLYVLTKHYGFNIFNIANECGENQQGCVSIAAPLADINKASLRYFGRTIDSSKVNINSDGNVVPDLPTGMGIITDEYVSATGPDENGIYTIRFRIKEEGPSSLSYYLYVTYDEGSDHVVYKGFTQGK